MKRKTISGQQNYHHGSLKTVIMDAALEMVAESGLESLSLREIARRIGVTTAAPYYHYKDRQSLLIELAIAGFAELFEALKYARDTTSAAEDQVRSAVTTYLHFGQRHRALYSIMFSGKFATHSRLQEMVSIATASLKILSQSIATTSNLGKSKSSEAAFCAWSLVHGILTLDRNGVLDESVAEQERLALQGVCAIVNGMSQEILPMAAKVPSQDRRSKHKERG